MEKRTSPVVCLALAASLWMLPAVRAQDLYVTNLDQLVAEAYSGEHCFSFPFLPLPWWAYSIDGGEPWFFDCSEIDCTNLLVSPTNLDSGVTAYGVLLTKNFLTGETILQPQGSTDVVATVEPPSGYVFGASPGDAMLYRFWSQLTNCPDCYGIDGEAPPPRLMLQALLANASDYATYAAYESNLEAQAATSATAMTMGGGLMAMDDDDDGGDDPCTLTNLLQTFAVTNITQTANGISITFQSCQFFRYLIFTASQLASSTVWFPQAYVWGTPGHSSTTWTDTSTTNSDGSAVTQRFYRVQRILGNTIAAALYHSLAVTEDPTLWTWGDNYYGELGAGLAGPSDSSCNQYPSRPFPGEVADVTSCAGQTVSNAVAVAGGRFNIDYSYSVVADAGGTVWTAGDNSEGQLGNGSTVSPSTFAPIAGISSVVSVAAGMDHTLALRADGTVWAWGDDTDTVLGSSNPGVLGAGSLPSTFTNVPIQTLIPSGTIITAIAAGQSWSLALDTTGQLWGWGDNSSGQIGAGVPVCGLGASSCTTNVPVPVAGISNVIAIAAGTLHAIAITADKTVWTWGDDTSQQLGRSLTNGYQFDPQPAPVAGLSNVVAIGAGDPSSLAVTSNGWLYGWGENGAGELGISGGGEYLTPTQVSTISNVVLVTAGGAHTMAMTTQGGTNQYYGWGANDYGQVGNGTNSDNGNTEQDTPAQLQFCTRCQREVQLGTSGSFTAQCNGTLYLYFNTDNFGACAGQYNVTFGGLATNVPANADCGIAVGTVTNGQVCTFTASGFCTYDIFGHAADPNGNPPSGPPADCSDFNTINITNAPCPTATCFSLVGRIQ